MRRSPTAKYLAGGQSLVPAMKLRLASPSDLVDLGGDRRPDGHPVSDGGSVTVGAMARHAEVAASADGAEGDSGARAARRHIGDRQVRHMGTIGGSLANSDPAADYPAAVLGLGATITTNKRKIAADEFFKGLFETALEPGELITRSRFPVAQARRLHEVQEPGLALRAGRRVRGRSRRRTCASRVTGRGSRAFSATSDMEKALAAQVRARRGRRHQGRARRAEQRPARLAPSTAPTSSP